MMKKIIAIITLSCLLLFGCKSTPQIPTYYDGGSTNVIMQTQFNEENYVWEGFIFSTNRVDNIGK